MFEYEWDHGGWDVFAGFHLTAWAFGLHIEAARSIQQLQVGLGPFYLIVDHNG